MPTLLRGELFEIGQLTGDLLGRFVEIQSGIRSWHVVMFVPVDFDQHARDAHAIAECLDSVLERLSAIAAAVGSGTPEDDFVQALGHYLCALRNSVSSYEHLTRVMGFHCRRQRLRGAFRVLRLRRDFAATVETYRKHGSALQRAWNALEKT